MTDNITELRASYAAALRHDADINQRARHEYDQRHQPWDDEPDSPQDQAAAIRARYPQVDIAQLLADNQPEREWVIDRLLPAGASISLVAAAGTGKSLLALGAALAVATGPGSFAGLHIPQPRQVLYIDLENTRDDLRERFQAYGVTPGHDLHRFHYLSFPDTPPLDTRQGGQELEAILDAYNIQPHDLVILDSLQRVTAGPENDSDTLRAFYLYTGMLLKRRALTVLRLDNTGKDTERGARGTSGKKDDVDLELILQADPDQPERLTIRLAKTRLADMQPITLIRREDEDGTLYYDADEDPFLARVHEAAAALDRLAVDPDAARDTCYKTLRRAGYSYTRRVVRAAADSRRREARQMPLDGRAAAAPNPAARILTRGNTVQEFGDGAPETSETANPDTQNALTRQNDRSVSRQNPPNPAARPSTDTRAATDGATRRDPEKTPPDKATRRADSTRRDTARPSAGAAPNARPSIEGRAGGAQAAHQPAVCTICGQPMRNLGDGATTHPTCTPTPQPDQEGDTP